MSQTFQENQTFFDEIVSEVWGGMMQKVRMASISMAKGDAGRADEYI